MSCGVACVFEKKRVRKKIHSGLWEELGAGCGRFTPESPLHDTAMFHNGNLAL